VNSVSEEDASVDPTKRLRNKHFKDIILPRVSVAHFTMICCECGFVGWWLRGTRIAFASLHCRHGFREKELIRKIRIHSYFTNELKMNQQYSN
jgi:hypothetical protein